MSNCFIIFFKLFSKFILCLFFQLIIFVPELISVYSCIAYTLYVVDKQKCFNSCTLVSYNTPGCYCVFRFALICQHNGKCRVSAEAHCCEWNMPAHSHNKLKTNSQFSLFLVSFSAWAQGARLSLLSVSFCSSQVFAFRSLS